MKQKQILFSCGREDLDVTKILKIDIAQFCTITGLHPDHCLPKPLPNSKLLYIASTKLKDNLVTINELIEAVWQHLANIHSGVAKNSRIPTADLRRYNHYLHFIVFKMMECIQICLLEDGYNKAKKEDGIVTLLGKINNAYKHSNIFYESNTQYHNFPAITVFYDYSNESYKGGYVDTNKLSYYNCYLNQIVAGFQDFLENIYNISNNIAKHRTEAKEFAGFKIVSP